MGSSLTRLLATKGLGTDGPAFRETQTPETLLLRPPGYYKEPHSREASLGNPVHAHDHCPQPCAE